MAKEAKGPHDYTGLCISCVKFTLPKGNHSFGVCRLPANNGIMKHIFAGCNLYVKKEIPKKK